MELIKQSIWRIAKQIIIQYWKLDAHIVINFNLEEIITCLVWSILITIDMVKIRRDMPLDQGTSKLPQKC